jgi:hypothetical protein
MPTTLHRGDTTLEHSCAGATSALVGSVTIWATNSIGLGVLAFLGSLVVLGPALRLYEKRGP